MARITDSEMEKLVKYGCFPWEICWLDDENSIPAAKLIPMYRKHYKTLDEFMFKATKRLSRDSGHRHTNAKAKCYLAQRVKGQINDMFRRELGPLSQLIGYSIDELMSHLESNFQPGMSWTEMHKWHIDHIKPRSLFTTKQIKECFELSNLSPMWAKDNMKKGKNWQK